MKIGKVPLPAIWRIGTKLWPHWPKDGPAPAMAAPPYMKDTGEMGGGGPSKIHVLAISPSYPCQLSCKYCAVPGNAREIEKNREAVCQAKKLDIAQMMRVLEEKDVLDLKEPIQLSAGEITILPNKKEILDSLSKYPVQVFSNCVLYDAQISEMISRKDGSFLNVSVDAGTRETYREVKGLDAV